MRYLYSEWDGLQELSALDAEQVLETLSDDLMNFGDLQHALRNMLQRGIGNTPNGPIPGLRDLLQQVRQQRRERLDHFDLDGVMEDVKRQLAEILRIERDTIEQRLHEASGDSGDTLEPVEDHNSSTETDEPLGASARNRPTHDVSNATRSE